MGLRKKVIEAQTWIALKLKVFEVTKLNYATISNLIALSNPLLSSRQATNTGQVKNAKECGFLLNSRVSSYILQLCRIRHCKLPQVCGVRIFREFVGKIESSV